MTPRFDPSPHPSAASPTVSVAVVVPARDEAPRIADVVRSVPPFVERIILVDDGSRDATVERALSVGDPRLEIIAHPLPKGVGAAITTGYRHAFARGADVVVVMAGDGQMAPEDLEPLLAPVVRGRAGYAKGNRLDHPEARRAMSFARRLGAEVLSRLTSLAVGCTVRDSQCGYTAIARSAWSAIDSQPIWPSYGYPNDLLVRLARRGVACEEVPVRPIYVTKRGGMGAHHAIFVVPFVLARALVLAP